MSEYGEYVREYQLYLARLDSMATALRELGDTWAASFVDSLHGYISRQGVNQWGPSAKQSETLRKIEERHGDLLTNAAKRRDVVKRRAEFMVRFEQLKSAVDAANDTWLKGFLQTVEQNMKQSRPLSPKQKATLNQALHRYKIAAYSYDCR